MENIVQKHIDLIHSTVLNKYNIKPEDILNIYIFGSQVYGTATSNSDFDISLVIKNKIGVNNQEIKHPIVNIHIYEDDFFQEKLNEHKIGFLECIMADDLFKIENKKFFFNLNKSVLRKEISSVANNSWVKCKKKLLVEQDEYDIGVKSLFHSMRIADFGKQIAIKGKVEDFSSMNYLWDEIKYRHDLTWNYLYETYKKDYNRLMSEFRLVAPKEEKSSTSKNKNKSNKKP